MEEATESMQLLASVFFFLAILQTFFVGKIRTLGKRFRKGSFLRRVFHVAGEVELVFVLWSIPFCLCLWLARGIESTVQYLADLDFRGPFFVFVIMVVASTRPVIESAKSLMLFIVRLFPIDKRLSLYFTCLSVGPLLGSLMGEPAAMVVTALILKESFYKYPLSPRFQYMTLAVLFVNISIGGILTPFAAPPVLMVAEKWEWGLKEVFHLFGVKALIAVLLNAGLSIAVVRKELLQLKTDWKHQTRHATTPLLLRWIHLAFLALVVVNSHHPITLLFILFAFLGLVGWSRAHQEELKIQESFLVACFLGGLVVLGNMQDWWLKPIILELQSVSLFVSTTMLTAITDNAALTYLGSQVDHLPDAYKYALVAGAVSGGGLTVIANAPNPAGYSILRKYFEKENVDPVKLLVAAIIPTVIAMICFWLI